MSIIITNRKPLDNGRLLISASESFEVKGGDLVECEDYQAIVIRSSGDGIVIQPWCTPDGCDLKRFDNEFAIGCAVTKHEVESFASPIECPKPQFTVGDAQFKHEKHNNDSWRNEFLTELQQLMYNYEVLSCSAVLSLNEMEQSKINSARVTQIF